MPDISSLEPIKYTPWTNGKYKAEAGLKQFDKDSQLVFEIDHNYYRYLSNKQQCRQENIHKYYLSQDENNDTLNLINQFMIEELVTKYPDFFALENFPQKKVLTNYLTGEEITCDHNLNLLSNNKRIDLFDAVCSQVQEDVAIWQTNNDNDWLSNLHICAPNYWSAAEKIGADFRQVHQNVPGMNSLNNNYHGMMNGIINKNRSFYRFIWEVVSDIRLNHHPDPVSGFSEAEWQGKTFDPDKPELYIRVERQTIHGFAAARAILFTIRTYFYKVESLTIPETASFKKALLSMPPESREYKYLTAIYDDIINWLDNLIK